MKILKQTVIIVIATFVFALAIGLFILPGKVLTGGVAGLATLLSPVVPFDEDIIVIVINTLLFIAGSIFLGREFFVNTLIYSITYPFALLIVTRHMPSIDIDPLLGAVYGGIIGGVAIGMMFRNGGSSGGTDVIALIMEKYFKIPINRTIMVTDSLTVIAGLYLYGLNSVLIGLISVILTTFALERTLNIYTGIRARKYEIISDKYQEIADDIHSSLNRGSTLLDVTGGYTGEKRKMLVVVVSDEQHEAINEIIGKHDPSAFVIISNTHEVNGEGFTYEPRL